MFERHVEELAQLRIRSQILAGRNGAVGEILRQRIGCEHVRRAPIGIAGELVQQDHQRQRARRVFQPAVQLASGGGEVRALEAFAEHGIECGVLGEPLLRTRIEPK
ncbi:hypothetical protein D9M69_666290 [compost metagenome]